MCQSLFDHHKTKPRSTHCSGLINRYVGNLQPCRACFRLPARVCAQERGERELIIDALGNAASAAAPAAIRHQYPQHHFAPLRRLVEARNRCYGSTANSFGEYAPEPTQKRKEGRPLVRDSTMNRPLVSRSVGSGPIQGVIAYKIQKPIHGPHLRLGFLTTGRTR